ncbi:MAG TPA: YraN family protein, partial [Acidiphilium sp.]
KTRRTARAAVESVSKRQQRRLAAAAEIVLAEHPDWQREGIRFDVALVVGESVLRIADAFRPGD